MDFLDSIRELFPGKSDNTSITAPKEDNTLAPLHEEVKKSKLGAGQIDQIFQIVASGKALPGTKQFVEALGIGMEQNGMAPTAAFGPFGHIRDMFSPKAQNVIAQQEIANKIGGVVL